MDGLTLLVGVLLGVLTSIPTALVIAALITPRPGGRGVVVEQRSLAAFPPVIVVDVVDSERIPRCPVHLLTGGENERRICSSWEIVI